MRDERDRGTDEFGVAWSDHELVLHESTLAIEEIPIRHSVERVQKRGQRDEGAARAPRRFTKPGLIEYACRARVHEASGRREVPAWKSGGPRRAGVRSMWDQRAQRGVISAGGGSIVPDHLGENCSAHLCHRVSIGVIHRLHGRHCAVEVVESLGIDSTHAVSTRVSRTAAFTMTPVRPIPPAVAQNSSGSFSGSNGR